MKVYTFKEKKQSGLDDPAKFKKVKTQLFVSNLNENSHKDMQRDSNNNVYYLNEETDDLTLVQQPSQEPQIKLSIQKLKCSVDQNRNSPDSISVMSKVSSRRRSRMIPIDCTEEDPDTEQSFNNLTFHQNLNMMLTSTFNGNESSENQQNMHRELDRVLLGSGMVGQDDRNSHLLNYQSVAE
jgi:hypothetical protein